MPTRTRRDEKAAGHRLATYTTSFGIGLIRLEGDLPVGLGLPVAGRVVDAGPDDVWSPLLERYFLGEPQAFPLDVDRYIARTGLSSFEGDVIRALADVPYGGLVSYGDLARAAGHPRAWRALGTVMAGNELPVILPCHRVVRSDGSLGRYGDDPSWKRRLLELEGVDTRLWREAS
jgi:methylated-DNA-[protein]-cysteine S-methyltransferase